jgi:hypothetical protein
MNTRGWRVVLCGGLILTFSACGSSVTAPTGSSTSTATIESVVTTFRGAVVESAPVVIPSPEALDVEVKVAFGMPADSRATMYLCVMETSSSIGVGNCVAATDTVGDFQTHGSVLRMGISLFKTDGVSRTTNYLYVGLTEGALPWNLSGPSPPRVGDMFGNNRVLATFQAARTVTFR